MHNLYIRTFVTLFAVLIISSCSSPTVKQPVTVIQPTKKTVKKYVPQAPLTPTKQKKLDRLYSHYRGWKGTPYRMGGMSKNGVDCSGFVYLTYRTVAGIKLPRTTRQQMRLGTEVPLHSLEAGDLLFFNTGWYSRHVGIYLQKGSFMHASTSHGVMISRLSEKYWKNSFHVAKRIIFQ